MRTLAILALIFIPAGTFHYWQGWTYVAVFVICSGAYTMYVAKHDPALLKRRTEAGISLDPVCIVGRPTNDAAEPYQKWWFTIDRALVKSPWEILRVCSKSLSRITELSQHEPDGGKSKEGQCIAVEILKIFGKAPAAIEPGDCALDYPAFWEDHEPFGMIRTFDDFCFKAGKDLGKIGIEERALIRAVVEQFLQ